MTRQRLQKLIASAGLCSRRHAENLIRAGRVQVNHCQAKLGDQADPQNDHIEVDGRPLSSPPSPRLILLNKPPGVITSCCDPQGRKTVLDLVPKSLRRGLHPVGRLDGDSRGALLLTNQGEMTLQLTHPRYSHRKTYRVQVQGRPTPATLQRWSHGVELDGLPTQPAEVSVVEQRAHQSLLKVILREGRNRQIRRVADALGHPVLDLQRTAIASIDLGSLPEGSWREVTRSEWDFIRLERNETSS